MQFLERLGMTRGDDLRDLRCQLLADPGQIGQVPAFGEHLAELGTQRAQRARGVTVGTYTERIGLLDLKKIRHLLEDCRNIFVVHRHWILPESGWRLATRADSQRLEVVDHAPAQRRIRQAPETCTHIVHHMMQLRGGRDSTGHSRM